MANVATREALMAQRGKLKKEKLLIEDWDLEVWVRELTGRERDFYESSLLEAKKVGRKMELIPNLANMKAKMVVQCVVDENGTRLFKDSDVAEVGELPASGLEQIIKLAQRLSGMDEEAAEEAEKNSGKMAGAGSTSSSPAISEA